MEIKTCTAKAYKEAMHNIDNIKINLFKGGRVNFCKIGALNWPACASGNFGIVFHVFCSKGESWAVKCFFNVTKEQNELYNTKKNYIKDLKNNNSIDCIIDFDYAEKGILVNGHLWPILTMKWINGKSIDKYISDNINNKVKMLELSKKWLNVCKVLNEYKIAHGDMQHGNILITENEEIFLVDYDGMCVPDIEGKKIFEKGHDSYQHPLRAKEVNLNLTIDHFSSWIIYYSILICHFEKSIWKQFYKEDQLLFGKVDYEQPENSEILNRLKNSSNDFLVKIAKNIEILINYDKIEKIPKVHNIFRLEPGGRRPKPPINPDVEISKPVIRAEEKNFEDIIKRVIKRGQLYNEHHKKTKK